MASAVSWCNVNEKAAGRAKKVTGEAQQIFPVNNM
jgi:hypothetical protein